MSTRKTISNVLLSQLYETTKERVKIQVQSADSVCITTDSWTSRGIESYLSLTAHYLDNNFELQSSLLGCFVFNEKHSAENLAEELN